MYEAGGDHQSFRIEGLVVYTIVSIVIVITSERVGGVTLSLNHT